MIEKTFVDRVPKYPNRVKLSPVAGQANTYDMTRADEPTQEGTPLDKLAFESIIHSRLTGRYYVPAVARTLNAGLEGYTVSPIPTSGWVYDADDRLTARSGLYIARGSSDNNTSANRVADAFGSSGWQSVGGLESWIEIYHTQVLKVQKIRFSLEMQASSRLTQMEIQGSANGTTWNALLTLTSVSTGEVEYTLNSTGDYNYYRIVFTSSSSNRITVSDFAYTLYDVRTYTNVYTVAEGLPTSWSNGQRLTIYTPAANTYAVTANTLNGVTVNIIMQANKYYELVYISGSALFVAREV